MEIEEQWLQVEGHPDYYVSTFGRVKSIRKGFERYLKLTPRRGDGYVCVGLCSNGIMDKVPVHRLVAKAFIPNPNKYPMVDHADHVRYNNKVGNLSWVTNQMNAQLSYSRGFAKPNRGNSKLSQEQINEVCDLYSNSKLSLKEISSKYNICTASVTRCANTMKVPLRGQNADNKKHFTLEQIGRMMMLRAKGMSYEAIGKEFNLGETSTEKIFKGKHWFHNVPLVMDNTWQLQLVFA